MPGRSTRGGHTLRPRLSARCPGHWQRIGAAARRGGRTQVHRRGNVLHREAGPWTPTVHRFLRHLETAGFAATPHIVGSGFDEQGRETLTFVEGEFTHPGPVITRSSCGGVAGDHSGTREFAGPR